MTDKPLDVVYLLVKEGGIWYSPPQTSSLACWEAAYQWECSHFDMITKDTYEKFRNRMRKDGWAARKVAITHVH